MTDRTADHIPTATRAQKQVLLRHSAWVRLTHWVWVVALIVLFMSGLQIFNAHPSLNFGQTTTFDLAKTGADRLILDIDNEGRQGVTTILGHSFDTTGVLGISQTSSGLAARAFPSWITIPADQDLAQGRRWHFLFAWILVIDGLIYFTFGLVSGHVWRDLVPRLKDWRALPRDIVAHLKLDFAHGPGGGRYNVLQKLAYAAVLFIVLPLLILAGLDMSPGMDAIAPWLNDVFGGRQSARTVHFIMAWTLVLFVLVHVVMVILSGPINNLRSMITGRFAYKGEDR